MFSNLKISKTDKFEIYLNKLNVIKIDINGFLHNTKNIKNLFGKINATLLQEFIEEFPNIQFESDDTIVHCIQKVYAQTKQTFVIIIDEYDVLIREQVPSAVFDNYLNFLSGIFKNSTLHLAISLAYLTGILPIVRDKIQSKMNEFDEYSSLMLRNLLNLLALQTMKLKHYAIHTISILKNADVGTMDTNNMIMRYIVQNRL